VPTERPAIVPVLPLVLTVATPVLLLLHVPPGLGLDNAVLLPVHTDAIPVFAARGLTVTVVVAEHEPTV
jgi:hypothetical protein